MTAEYSMLPGSTRPRKRRDCRAKVDGRSTEIQRLIGRGLRAVTDTVGLGTVEKGDRHRAGKLLGGFGIDCGSEPVPLFHSIQPTSPFPVPKLQTLAFFGDFGYHPV